MMDMISSLERLSNAVGVGGLTQAADEAQSMLGEFCDEIERDALGNVIGYRRCGGENARLLLLEAHIDEVGLIVTDIDDMGFIHAAPCGGVDVRALPAAEVMIFGDKPYPGVICSIPPHLKKKDDKDILPDIVDMGIDVGMNAEEAKSHIRQGSRISFKPNFTALDDYHVSGKAMDDRAGVAAILYCLDILKEQQTETDYDIAVIFAVQEELGCRGAAVSAYRVSPDYAIAVDVSFALTPDADSAKCGRLGEGAMIGRSPTLDNCMANQLVKLAEENDIPYQNEVMGGATGTDAESISDAHAGIPTALLSVPLRYMHTPSELIDIRDVQNVGRLMALFAEKGGSGL
ncbi:MAG: M20/M25/M40 family metallo-hydrolase [Oscillospiraceae bacterium]|nr:M20/M25/M40 family metallo-hydrolase [Oscillospiraceae bacterium]MDD4414507.1 M20/M25/M40 family metallo-hydrolase [Oscillospiraceae bacterium]